MDEMGGVIRNKKGEVENKKWGGNRERIGEYITQ